MGLTIKWSKNQSDYLTEKVARCELKPIEVREIKTHSTSTVVDLIIQECDYTDIGKLQTKLQNCWYEYNNLKCPAIKECDCSLEDLENNLKEIKYLKDKCINF